ncbi:phosphopantetheine-binding protein [Cylindrospermum sp. NIES-4074]|nr:phosphopantetheine-binding protein [Cylindrospermum sp. NIES-4074]
METQNLDIQNSQAVQIPLNTDNKTSKSVTRAEIQAWIVTYIADLLQIDADEIDVTIPFDRYGLDSSAAVGMTGDLETWLRYELDATLLYDYPTIEILSQYLSETINTQK